MRIRTFGLLTRVDHTLTAVIHSRPSGRHGRTLCMPVTSASPASRRASSHERRFRLRPQLEGLQPPRRRTAHRRCAATRSRRLTGLDRFHRPALHRRRLRQRPLQPGRGAARRAACTRSTTTSTRWPTTRDAESRVRAGPCRWTIEQGSILDEAYVRRLGTFDIVYSWGVLHHTGQMHEAFERAADLVAPGRPRRDRHLQRSGLDQPLLARGEACLQRQRRFASARRHRASALSAGPVDGSATLKSRRPERGMRLWTDLLDWLGGYPFEVATPDACDRDLRAARLHVTGPVDVRAPARLQRVPLPPALSRRLRLRRSTTNANIAQR